MSTKLSNLVISPPVAVLSSIVILIIGIPSNFLIASSLTKESGPQGKEDITGYIFEPWHLRYVGKALAKELYKNNLTLEEYVRVNKKGGLKSTLC